MERPAAEQVFGLAPDEASVRAARGLVRPGAWTETGCSAEWVWGSCRGSAAEPYRVACVVDGPLFRCTCPSYKVPCKHALALLLLWVEGHVAPAPAPPDVAAWAAAQGPGHGAGWPRLDRSCELPASAGTPGSDRPGAAARLPDPASEERRAERIASGMAELTAWIGDLLRRGLAWAQSQPYAFWDAMGARLVDAQAPAAAGLVREVPSLIRAGGDWPGRVLARIGRLQLLAAGWARYDRLPEQTRADLRTAAGWPWPSAQVLAGGREEDRWYVLGRVTAEQDNLTVRRTWLWGRESSRLGLVLDFARPGRAFAWELWPGAEIAGGVARYPGSDQLRVLVPEGVHPDGDGGEDRAEDLPGVPGPEAPPGWATLTEMATARGRHLARDPWSARWPVSVAGVVPAPGRRGWEIQDREGRRLPLTGDEATHWRLLSLSGGRPLHLIGEWDDVGVQPLGAWVDTRMVAL